AIGFLGVLQHEVKYDGADITAEEVEPIVYSSDPNFRPSDLEVGGDGALYVADWSNALIGHMQHNMRDPNRDHEHGRIYRVTYEGRDLLQPVKLKNKPIPEVLNALFAKENGVRYRARLELSGRQTEDVLADVAKFVGKLNPEKTDDAQAMLECLWVHEEHRVPNVALVQALSQKATDGRVRAAAIRTLGHWGQKVTDWQPILAAAAEDESALVRAEAVKAAVSFTGLAAAEVIFEVANHPLDPELETVLNYAKNQIQVDSVVQDAIKAGKSVSAAAQKYVLRNASVEDLLKLERSEAVYRAILERPTATVDNIREAISGLSGDAGKQLDVLLQTIKQFDANQIDANLAAMGQLLASQSPAALSSVLDSVKQLATEAQSDEVRQAAYAAWITAIGSGKEIFAKAAASKDRLKDVLLSVSLVPSESLRAELFESVRPLLSKLPANLAAERSGATLAQPGIKVDYFQPNPNNVALETLADLKPAASGIVPEIVFDVPQLIRRDEFALRFTGSILIEKAGRYRFFISSDDGSRLYINNELVIDNDGLHGMVEKSGRINLAAGTHSIAVTYFDNGGGDGLQVAWAGPGFRKQAIPNSVLSVAESDTLHDIAIGVLDSIPGYAAEKFDSLAELIQANRYRVSAVRALLQVPTDAWPVEKSATLAETLASYVGEIPASLRTGKEALEAMRLTDMLAARLPDEQRLAFQARLSDLAVNVIRIGTVPHRMIYDKERMVIQAGKPVEFVFSNTDNMPHNFAIVQPGSLEEIGLMAEATSQEPDALARHYVPKSDKVMLSSRLLQPTETQAISFEAPSEPGVYPYVCTYPGHWRRMYGALYVVADLKQYLADPDAYLAANPLPLQDELLKYNARNTEWAFDDLAPSSMTLAIGHGDHADHQHATEARNFEVGKSVFKAASCVSCHQLGGEGIQFGPELAKLDMEKNKPTHILESLLDPSKVIDDKYRSYTFVLDSGQSITGMILDETDTEVKVIIDPIAKPEPTVLKKSQIEERIKSPVSVMPLGLANKLSREEILDLIAYVHSGGDPKHAVFAGGHDHDH
ncbi:MAG: HEAT repeat domain-containing protein, partial [Planctomycetales bacterium]|nr:HEAT repeat domain-containing protein [Planctomycetales bacterium]